MNYDLCGEMFVSTKASIDTIQANSENTVHQGY